MLTVLALLCLAVAAVWFVIGRAWPMALVALGLALWLLASTGPIRIG